MKNVYKFDEPGTLSKPGWIGRLVRLLMAALMFYLLYVVYLNLNNFVEGAPEQAILWFLVLLAFFLLSPVVNIGFGKLWGNNPQSWFLIILYILINVGTFSKNAYWTLETAYLILGLQIYVFSHLGISFLLASILATPGCEMRSIPHLYTIFTGNKTREHFCPGMLDSVDKWEMKLAK
jgi:hypothetical protein